LTHNLEVPLLSTMLLYSREDVFRPLAGALGALGVSPIHLRNCEGVQRRMVPADVPQLVFTDVRLADGEWRDVLSHCANVGSPVGVVVVTTGVDVLLFLDALEASADYITPPFDLYELAHLIRCVYGRLTERRQKVARRVRDRGCGECLKKR